jgi:anti-sigma regulatory factor (Ser/Thr protein kinase)
VSEAFSADRRLFGDDAILRQLERTHGMNARSVCAGMRLALSEFTVGAEQSDDITMLALVYGVPPEQCATMEISADIGQLAHVQHLVHEELYRHAAPSSVTFALDIAVEELFVNICEHAYPDAPPEEPGEVHVECVYDASIRAMRVTLIDKGVPFDPLLRLEMVEGDPTAGIGIRLAVRSVDKVTYTREDGRNVCSITKGW